MAAREAVSLYVERAVEGANEADGPFSAAYLNGDFESVAHPIDVRVECIVDLVELEVVADDRVGHELALAHEGQGPAAVHPALAARGVDADIAAHGEVHIQLDGARVPGHDSDAPAALDVLERILHGPRAARALEDGVGAFAARDLAHARPQLFPPHVDHDVGAEPTADLETLVTRAAQNHPLGAQGLAELHRHETDGSRPEDQHGLAGDVAAHEVEGPEGRGGRRDHAGLLEGEVVGQAVQRVDVVDGILGEAAVAREPLGAVALRHVAVVQAGRVPALDAVLAALTALVHLDGHTVAHAELVDARTERRHRARILVAHDEPAFGLAQELSVEHLHVGATDRRDLDLQQRLARPRLGHGPGLHPHVVGAMENDRLHGGWNRHQLVSFRRPP